MATDSPQPTPTPQAVATTVASASVAPAQGSPVGQAIAEGGSQATNPVETLPKVGFFQQKWVQSILPAATSVLIHLAIVVVGFITLKAVEVVTVVVREQIIVPEGVLIEGAEVGGVPNPGMGDPNLAGAQDQIEVATAAEQWSTQPNQQLAQNLMGGGSADGATELTSATIGIGGGGLRGRGPGAGSGEGGGPAGAFGVPGGSGSGPRAPFVGISGNARKVVYVCDASGSMMNVFGSLRMELRKAIDALRPSQAFNILFFADDETIALHRGSLIMATADNKRRAYEFIPSIPPRGQTNPYAALRAAFAMQPELMYVLTDGFDNIASFDELINEFRKLNVDKKVRVNAILVGGPETPRELVDVMRRIASENGGVFRMVGQDEF